MNERIRLIRKNANLNMALFGDKIGITSSAVSRIESGENSPKDQTIMLICREFNVDEHWLRTGEGEMYNLPKDEVADIVSDLLIEQNPMYDIIVDILSTYQQLDSKSKDVLKKFIVDVANKASSRD